MNRYLITLRSTLDALTANRVLRDRGFYTSFVSIGPRDDQRATTVGLEVEADSDSEVRDLLGKAGVTVDELTTIPEGSSPSRAGTR